MRKGATMKKDIIRYSALIIIVLIVAIFIYPTLYRYDKLNQKIPVRINRITGTAAMLDTDGWKEMKSDTPQPTEMEAFKSQVESQINADRERIKSQLKTEIKQEILQEINNDINAYKQNQLDPNNYFGQGSTMDEVKKIMGTPTSVTKSDFTKQETWFYGSSSVTFKNGKVDEWSESPFGQKLKIK
jgi:hypothetical protein